jgi:predicted nucleic acid-binding Zn ribbon protein
MSKWKGKEPGEGKREPQRIGEVLSRLMARRGYAQLQVADELLSVWQSAVGPEMARNTRPGNLGRGVLQITVRNSLVLQELTFQKRELLARMQQSGFSKVRDLRFRLGEVD